MYREAGSRSSCDFDVIQRFPSTESENERHSAEVENENV